MGIITIVALGSLTLIIAAGLLTLRSPGRIRPRPQDFERLQFSSARDVLQYMKEQRIGYIAVEGGAKWEAKDLRQQGIVNLLRAKYFELHEAEQRSYFSELSADHVAQARALLAARPEKNLRSYRQQLSKLMIYVKDPDCLAEIRSELQAIMPKVQEEQVRAALDNPPAEIDEEHLALLTNYLEEHPGFMLARELEAEIERVKGLLGGPM